MDKSAKAHVLEIYRPFYERITASSPTAPDGMAGTAGMTDAYRRPWRHRAIACKRNPIPLAGPACPGQDSSRGLGPNGTGNKLQQLGPGDALAT
ncbi:MULTISPECIES: hypothetical protein [Streptomyces]|uniref:hypothetical protein n=1 Tax=Streptomyces TaxID=1883 RepID=UPI00123ADCF8|nr:hypothetical protein [Streptomyces venezuelae]